MTCLVAIKKEDCIVINHVNSLISRKFQVSFNPKTMIYYALNYKQSNKAPLKIINEPINDSQQNMIHYICRVTCKLYWLKIEYRKTENVHSSNPITEDSSLWNNWNVHRWIEMETKPNGTREPCKNSGKKQFNI